jgi:inosose dehydratase
VLLDESGVRQMFHPHADAHVDDNERTTRFLELTDPATVALCLDTGHIAYAGGDNRAWWRATRPDRLRPPQVDRPRRRRQRPREGMSFAQPCSTARWSNPTRRASNAGRCSPT